MFRPGFATTTGLPPPTVLWSTSGRPGDERVGDAQGHLGPVGQVAALIEVDLRRDRLVDPGGTGVGEPSGWQIRHRWVRARAQLDQLRGHRIERAPRTTAAWYAASRPAGDASPTGRGLTRAQDDASIIQHAGSDQLEPLGELDDIDLADTSSGRRPHRNAQ